MSRGRPTVKSPELLDRLLLRIMEGEDLTSICKDDDMPATSTIYNWMVKDDEFMEAYARAVSVRTHQMVLDALKIADRPKANRNDVEADKYRADMRIRVAGKLNPKHYGDKLDLNHSGNIKVDKITIDYIGVPPEGQ